MLNVLKLENIKPMLVNLTGVRLLVIFSLLLESPKTAEEINEYFEKNNYPKEIFSIDTLRNDLNALRYAGCDISRADKSNNFKYMIASHPFQLNIDMPQLKTCPPLYHHHLQENHIINFLFLFHKVFDPCLNHVKLYIYIGLILI